MAHGHNHLYEYDSMTSWKNEPVCGSFPASESLSAKVDPAGHYLPFAGSLVAVRPDNCCIQALGLLQKLVMQKLEGTEMLADPIPLNMIFLILHDLIRLDLRVTGFTGSCSFKWSMYTDLDKATAIVEQICHRFADRTITLRGDRIVNWLSESAALLLRPETEEDYALLMEWDSMFNEAFPREHPLVLHIPFLYFRPGMLDGDRLREAFEYAQFAPEEAPVFKIDPESLTAQKYLDLITRIDYPERLCIIDDGGSDRSVMLANIINHLAARRSLPVIAEARSASPNVQGFPVFPRVWDTLEKNGITPDRSCPFPRYLRHEEVPHFTRFAAVSREALDRLRLIRLPGERYENLTQFFYGVEDPGFMKESYDLVYKEFCARTETYLKCVYGNAEFNDPENVLFNTLSLLKLIS